MGKEKKPIVGIYGPHLFKKHGIVDFNGLISAIPQWYRTQGYDFLEKGRSEKSTSTGKYIESNWVGVKEVSSYVKYYIKINIWVRDLTDVAVEKNGKTLKLQRGRIELDIKSEMEKNYEKDGRRTFNTKKKFHDILRVFYEKYIMKSQLSAFEDKILFEYQDFIKELQKHLYPV